MGAFRLLDAGVELRVDCPGRVRVVQVWAACPGCGGSGHARSGVGFDHELRCGACEVSWEPGRTCLMWRPDPPSRQEVPDGYKWKEHNILPAFGSFSAEVREARGLGLELLEPGYYIPAPGEPDGDRLPLYTMRRGGLDRMTHCLGQEAGEVGYPIYFRPSERKGAE